ncbi:type II toxin-antitoxin system RelE family toxin [Viscerimonas tarda]
MRRIVFQVKNLNENKMLKEESEYKYNYTIKKNAAKYLDKLPNNYYKLIMIRIKDLQNDPYVNSIPMKGFPDRNIRRTRVGHFRLIYEIFDNLLVFSIIKVDNRGDAYKHLSDL